MLTDQQEQWLAFRKETERQAIASVKEKIASGEYPLEQSVCFCDADPAIHDKEIKTEDRFGIPHRIVVCQNCALVRANPRMTQEAYTRFYNEEYRRYSYRWLDRAAKSWEEEYEIIRNKEHGVAETLHTQLINEDIEFPKIVVDVGCYVGGMLDYFKEKGAETYGVEFNDEARAAANARGHKIYANMDELIASGVKADFVIMQDVIEHFLDLDEVKKVHLLLKPDAHLYVYTPGMFRRDPAGYWQLAHTWYFVASTFNWMMDELGFHATYIDEEICSFWQWRGPSTTWLPKPQEWVEYIVDEAEGKEERRLPPFRGVCKFTKKLLYDNMRRNFAKKVPDIQAIANTRNGPIIVIGGGPSIDGQVEKLRELSAQYPVITIARMYPWCLEHGISPDYVVSLDCSEEQEKGFNEISFDTTHLMASVTRPELLDKVLAEGAPCYLFDSRDDRKIKDLRRAAGYETCTVINSGGTVVVTCIAAAFTLGHTDLHIFGFDCMFPSTDQFHAKGIAGESVEQKVLTVEIDGEDVLTTPSFIEFARQALDLFSVGHNEGILKSVEFYGDSLISKLWDCRWRTDEEIAALEAEVAACN